MKTTKGEKAFYIFNYVFMILIGLTYILPFLNIIATSLSDGRAVLSGDVSIFPVGFTLEPYRLLIKETPVISSFFNSVVITAAGIVISMAFTVMAAYPLSKRFLYARNFFTFAAVFTMMFSGGLIPSYLVIKSLGLVNSYAAIWLPGAISTYNMLVMKTFFQNIPPELEEAARIDGAGEMTILFKIFIPLSKPVFATIALFYGVGYWNSFMSMIIYIVDTDKLNLAVLVQQMIRAQNMVSLNTMLDSSIKDTITPEGMKSAGIIVMIIPMILLYPFAQKYFEKGVMLGSIKG